MIGLVNSDAMHLPLPDQSVHCVVTSPPYFDLRQYIGTDQREIGREVCIKDYIANLIVIFREVWRVLRNDGTLWVVIGDSRNGSGGAGGDYNKGGLREGQPRYPGHRDPSLKDKDLCLVPQRFAIAMQEAGWYVRSEVIWHKTNGMPGSAQDRPGDSHEKVYLFSKSKRYYYDIDAVRYASGSNLRSVWSLSTSTYKGGSHYAKFPVSLVEVCVKAGTSSEGCCEVCGAPLKRIVLRSAREYNPEEAKRRIAATGGAISGGTARSTLGKTDKIVRKTVGWQSCNCVKLRTNRMSKPDNSVNIHAFSKQCVVLDPFAGSGTVGVVCKALGRSFIGVDLSYHYLHNDAKKRLCLDREFPI